MRYTIGIDVGGSKSAAIVLDEAGATVAVDWAEHHGDWQGRLLESCLASVERVTAAAGCRPQAVAAVGVAAAGLISADNSTLVHSPIIRESRLDLGRALAARLGRPVAVVNDANAALFAIARSMPAPVADRVLLLLTLGTGVGGAAMVGERILVGERGFATELGHITVDFEDRRPCVCGSTGCIEQYASGRGIAELAATNPPPSGTQAAFRSRGSAPPYTARDVVAVAADGDPWASALLANAGTMLGRALSVLAVIFDPGVVVITGTLGLAAGRWLLPAAKGEMRARWAYPDERPLPELRVDTLGPYAAATGAALLADKRMHDEAK